jgi:non-specific serine/threonine protein kinase/serine/threonine-protein kinase
MDDDLPRILRLVVEAVDSGRTPQDVCAESPELLAEVSRRVEQCRLVDDELNHLFPPSTPRSIIDMSGNSVAEAAGTVIGPFKLLKQIGEGGFGVVYMAEQQSPIRRRVAVKVIKPGMDTREVIGRFESERQALAMMDHPNIARVFDAGTTNTGRPYFVMELVDGVAITTYCDHAKLGITDRLRLMVPVCRAVQSAHGKGIIHRDIKPSNVLVTTNDGAPMPKIIDFGVAKATGGSLTEHTLLTRLALFVGTPAYMSPEQADRPGDGVDTRTDIYALGVLLYELLTGVTPIDQKILRVAAYGELPRLIREIEPPRPSSRLSNAATASTHSRDARRLERRLRGDLDCVVMKAIEKDRARRYDTAAAFADDLERYLAGDSVTAAPPGPVYRFKTFARKHRVALVTTALVTLALLLGIAGLSIGLVRATSARHLAEARQREADAQRRLAEQRQADADSQRRRAQAVLGFLTNDILAKASPAQTQDKAVRDTLVRALIEPAIHTVAQQFDDQPLLRAEIQQTLAHILNQLGRPDLAEIQAQAAWSERRKMLGNSNPATILALDEYCAALARQDRWEVLEPLIRQEWEEFRQAEGDDGPNAIVALTDYAWTLVQLGRWPAARAVLSDALANDRGAGRARTEGFAKLSAQVGETLRQYGDWSAAIAPLREATNILRTAAPASPDRGDDLFWLGMCLMAADRSAESHAVFVEKCDFDQRYSSSTHPTPVAAAFEGVRVAVTAFVSAAGARPLERAPTVLFAEMLFAGADLLRQTGKIDAAVPLLKAAVSVLRAAAPDDPHRGRDLYWLGNCLLATRQPREAEMIFRENYVFDLRTTGPELPVLPGSLQGLLASLNAQDKPADPIAIQRAYRSFETGAIQIAN